MEFLLALRDILVVLGPLITEFCRAMQDKEIRGMTNDLLNAKTKEDKLAIATRISGKLYGNGSS